MRLLPQSFALRLLLVAVVFATGTFFLVTIRGATPCATRTGSDCLRASQPEGPVTPKAPAKPVRPTQSAPKHSAPITPSDSRLRPLLSKPLFVRVKGPGFTAVFPFDGDPTEYEELNTSSPTFGSDLLVNRAHTRVCPSSFQHDLRCRGFVNEGYIVGIERFPGLTAQQALDKVAAKLIPSVFDHVHRGTFRGQPAIFATFHTNTGGFGPYIEVWKGGAVYGVWANGLTGGAEYAERFDDSFQFTR